MLNQRLSLVLAGQHRRQRAQFLGQFQHRQNPVPIRRAQALQLGCFNVGGVPAHVHLRRQPGCAAHRLFGAVVRADAGQDGARGVPGRHVADTALFDAPAAHIFFDMLGGPAQCDLAQRDQVALAEKILLRLLGLARDIDLAGLEPGNQLVRRRVDQHDLVGTVQHLVRHGFMDPDAGDRAYGAVQAFQMLHVQRRPAIDAGVQQLLHVLPALAVARAFDVGMRQLVHQQHGRLARQRCVQVEFLEHPAAVRHLAQRQHAEAVHQLSGLAAAMGFDHADQHLALR